MSKYDAGILENESANRFIKNIKGGYNIKLPAYYQNSKNSKGNINNSDKRNTENMPGITVITSTIRPEFMEKVFENYNRQTYQKKELIIVLNKNSMNIRKWMKKAKQYKNIRVFQLDERISFGQCYNFCVSKSKYDYIAPFDDDDYYAPNYLNDIVEAFQTSKADVVGKKTRYVYFESSGILAISNPNNENRYVDHIDGPTLSFNKKIFDKVRFTNQPVGVDGRFCKDCIDNGIKLYSTNKFNHVYIRHSSSHQHTWAISDDEFLSWCDVIGKIENYQEYVAK
ncbi:glycosyltransferase [Alkaliphilus sp. MSJ-5]|uniref:Glycosyltransferase n=1 Tax=Alkaliphilus flagellatus TaxID=2841507 RepID=A0ABS6FXX9_9FIRM|nr:glycosyltransferase [Alkaliphilus flagellatus]